MIVSVVPPSSVLCTDNVYGALPPLNWYVNVALESLSVPQIAFLSVVANVNFGSSSTVTEISVAALVQPLIV